MFKNNIIKKRVMAVIEQKIDEAQKLHDAESEELLVKFEDAIDALGEKLHSDKEALLERHVGMILGKILQ